MIDGTELRVRSYPRLHAMPAHVHAEPSMTIVVNGGYRETIARSERDYSRGHIAFVPAGAMHSQFFGPSGARQIIIRPQDTWLEYLADCRTALDASPHGNTQQFRLLGDRLLMELGTEDALSGVACEGILLEIVAAFARRHCGEGPAGNPPRWLRRAREFMQQNAHRSLSLGEVARQAGRHEVHLAREFRRYFGCSIGEFLRQSRTRHAAELLRGPHATISDVALECGFSSHSHLCRAFKLHYGITPTAYRANVLE